MWTPHRWLEQIGFEGLLERAQEREKESGRSAALEFVDRATEHLDPPLYREQVRRDVEYTLDHLRAGTAPAGIFPGVVVEFDHNAFLTDDEATLRNLPMQVAGRSITAPVGLVIEVDVTQHARVVHSRGIGWARCVALRRRTD